MLSLYYHDIMSSSYHHHIIIIIASAYHHHTIIILSTYHHIIIISSAVAVHRYLNRRNSATQHMMTNLLGRAYPNEYSSQVIRDVHLKFCINNTFFKNLDNDSDLVLDLTICDADLIGASSMHELRKVYQKTKNIDVDALRRKIYVVFKECSDDKHPMNKYLSSLCLFPIIVTQIRTYITLDHSQKAKKVCALYQWS